MTDQDLRRSPATAPASTPTPEADATARTDPDATASTDGTVTWACTAGFAPVFIFPFTPPERYGLRNLSEFQALMYRPLYWYGTQGRPEVDFELSLAEPPDWEDDHTVVVRLKPWRWSNGEPVCADNLIFWMHMLLAHKQDFGGYIPGYFPDNLVSFAKVDDAAVRFTFDRVYSRTWVLMNQLSAITPMPRAWDRTEHGPADATHEPAQADAVWAFLRALNEDRAHWDSSRVWSVVNGPWRLQTYTIEGDRGEAVLVPNELYDGPRKPRLTRFRQIPVATDDEEYRRLESGPEAPDGVQIGYLPFDRVVEPTLDPSVGGPNPLGHSYRLAPQTTFSIHYFPMNFNNPGKPGRLFAQLYLRQALQHVVDQDWAIAHVYQGYGYRTDGPIPALPASPYLSPAARTPTYPFDPERARALLAEHGWDVSRTPAVCVRPGPDGAGAGIEEGDPLSLQMRYASGHPTLTRCMHRFAADAARAGFEIRLAEVDPSLLVLEDTRCTPGPDTPCTWQLSDWNGGWVYGPGFFPTGEFLYRTGAGSNFGSYSDPGADALIDATVTSDDLADLYAYQDYIAEQAAVIWMPNFPLRLLEIAHGLHGVEPLNPFGLLNPEDWYYAP